MIFCSVSSKPITLKSRSLEACAAADFCPWSHECGDCLHEAGRKAAIHRTLLKWKQWKYKASLWDLHVDESVTQKWIFECCCLAIKFKKQKHPVAQNYFKWVSYQLETAIAFGWRGDKLRFQADHWCRFLQERPDCHSGEEEREESEALWRKLRMPGANIKMQDWADTVSDSKCK